MFLKAVGKQEKPYPGTRFGQRPGCVPVFLLALFDLESSKLSEEGKHQLDQAAAGMVQDAPCVIEILGYTDTTGSSSYNLTFSELRAKEVFLYLVGQHGIPLRQIHMVGLGSANPAEGNDTRQGQQINRRVEVRVYISG